MRARSVFQARGSTQSTVSLDLHRPQLSHHLAGAATGTGWTGPSGSDTIFTPWQHMILQLLTMIWSSRWQWARAGSRPSRLGKLLG